MRPIKTASGNVGQYSAAGRKLMGDFRKETGMSFLQDRPSIGGSTHGTGRQTELSDAFRLWASGFGGQSQPQAPAAPEPAFQPGDDPNTAAGGQARQDAAADQLGFSDPVAGGRKEAYAARRNSGVGLASLSRGFAASVLLK